MRYAAVFLSDPHAGLPESTAALVLYFRENNDADAWFWPGDIADLWVLSLFRRWYGETETKLVHTALGDLPVAGNHDDLLAKTGLLPTERLYVSPVTGKRLLVIHGNALDPFIVRHLIASILATWLNLAAMLTVDPMVNWLRKRVGRNGHWSLASAVKHWLRKGSYLQKVKARAVALAKERGVDGCIFGHTHEASVETRDGIMLVNTGAGRELTAAVEHCDGTWGIISLAP